jgi:ATP-dependent exoDNAse (exonuclease V) beta subunit
MAVLYCSGDKWRIVDYKTKTDGKASDDLDKKYQGQLTAYEKAFKETTGEDAEALTYRIDA